MTISLEEYRSHLETDRRRMVPITTVSVTQIEACRMIAQHLEQAARIYAQLGGATTSLTNDLIRKICEETRQSYRTPHSDIEDEPDPALVAAEAWLAAVRDGARHLEQFIRERDW